MGLPVSQRILNVQTLRALYKWNTIRPRIHLPEPDAIAGVSVIDMLARVCVEVAGNKTVTREWTRTRVEVTD